MSPSGFLFDSELIRAAHAAAWLAGDEWKDGSKILFISLGPPREAIPRKIPGKPSSLMLLDLAKFNN